MSLPMLTALKNKQMCFKCVRTHILWKFISVNWGLDDKRVLLWEICFILPAIGGTTNSESSEISGLRRYKSAVIRHHLQASAGRWLGDRILAAFSAAGTSIALSPLQFILNQLLQMGSDPSSPPLRTQISTSPLCILLGHRDWQVSLGNTCSSWDFPGIELSPCFW